MFLAQHGIASLAVERLAAGSQLPRAAFFHMRTLEMFRAAGIEDKVREQSAKEFEAEGALVIMDTLSGKKLADIIPSLNEGVDALSPCRRLFCTQPGPRTDPQGARARSRRPRARRTRGDRRLAGRQRRDHDGEGYAEWPRANAARQSIWSAPTARTARCASF
jgi:hypothetical protein